MNKIDRVGKSFIVIAIALFLALYLNIFSIGKSESHSIQDGLYFVFSLLKDNTPLQRGNYAEFCIPDKNVSDFALNRKLPLSKKCRFGAHSLVKNVVATKGDIISINNYGVFVNNKYIYNSKPLFNMFTYNYCNNYKLKSGEYLMMGTSKRSLDSRYFGIVNKSFVLGKGYLIWAKN